MRAIVWIVLAVSASTGFAGSNPAHSQSSTISCDRPRNAEEIIFCGQVLNRSAELIPRGSEKPSFDCVQAKMAPARLICADAELSRLDGELGTAFRRRKAQIPAVEQSRFVAEQFAWIRARNTRCRLDGQKNVAVGILGSSKHCMADAIRERITALSSPPEAPQPNLPTADDRGTVAERNRTNPNAINVEMSVATTASNPPTINGTTNLPDGTKLMATLTADRPCAPNCGAQGEAVVQNGRFTVPSESIRRKITAGSYTIEIVTPNAGLQPENVQAVLGRWGEHLEGPYVVTLSKNGYVPRSVNPSDLEKTIGYSIRYVKKITASRNTAPDAYWQRIEADNGAVYAIDVNSVTQNTNGTAVAVTCTVDNDSCPPWNMSRFHFDCRGHYRDLDRGGPMMVAPPRSVAGQMAALACAGAKDTRFADDSESAQPVRRPISTDYCVGFAHDACEHIKKVVEAYTPSQPLPSYCKPGFALVGSGLTDEQLRICYVITRFKRTTQDARPSTLVAASAAPVPAKPGEKVIGQWSGKGNGKSATFHIDRGTWEFRVTSTDFGRRLQGC